MKKDRSIFASTEHCIVLLVLLAMGLAYGCAGLVPKDLKYMVHMGPILPEGRGDYYVDLDDSSTVFSKEGVLIKVRYLKDDELNQRFPRLFDGRHINPYTFEGKPEGKDYIPLRFTTFEVTVINETYSKVQFDPATAVLYPDSGEEYRYYDPGREGAIILGGNSFSQYYKAELGISGNEKELALERMGIIYKTIYHRFRPVFRGSQRSGLLVFDPLPEDAREMRLKFNEFVLSFDASNLPEDTVDIEYRFAVTQNAVAQVKAE